MFTNFSIHYLFCSSMLRCLNYIIHMLLWAGTGGAALFYINYANYIWLISVANLNCNCTKHVADIGRLKFLWPGFTWRQIEIRIHVCQLWMFVNSKKYIQKTCEIKYRKIHNNINTKMQLFSFSLTSKLDSRLYWELGISSS